jgi:hypothetical protein
MGLVGFFRTVLILLAVYYTYKFLTKYVLPLMLKNYINKVSKKHRGNGDFQREEGDVTIQYGRDKNKKVDKDKGEYVDYEEVN